MSAPLAFEQLECPHCGYALAGLPSRTCPECGSAFDPATVQRHLRRSRRRRWLLSAALMAFVMYAPFSWLLFIHYPWNHERWLWVKLWPILPGLPATLMLRLTFDARLPEWMEFTSMGLLTLFALLLFTWLGTRGKWWLIITAMLALAGACWNGWIGYQLFYL